MRERRLIVRQIGSETVVYDRRTQRAHCLGPLAAAVWRASSGRHSLSPVAIARRLNAEGVEPVDETAVLVALRRLERAGLVARPARRAAEGASGDSGAPTDARREALRRVAALTGLAVLSVATRSPAQSASCRPGDPCTRSSQCCTGCCHDMARRCVAPGAGLRCLPG